MSSSKAWKDSPDSVELASELGLAPRKVSPNNANTLQPTYLDGWRKYAVFISCLVAMFLGNMEATIVNTALISIADDLGSYSKISWVVSAYLIGFVGVVIVNAKMSDIFGRKAMLLWTFSVFVVFSICCGTAQSMDQLIVFRALKGTGGAGLVSMPVITLYEVVPPDRYPKYATYIGLTLVLVNILGPILGGVISQDSTWRWIFYLNIPIAVPFAVCLAIAIPKGFPYHGNPNAPRLSFRFLLSRETFQRVDFAGSLLLLIGTVFFVAAFQEAGKTYEWESGFVISLLVLSGLAFIMFMVYERYITAKNSSMEPVFPWRFVHNRAWVGMLIVSAFHGAAWIVPVYQIPQRFQVLHGSSSLGAAVKLLPFSAAAPVSMILSSILAKKGQPPIYFLLFTSLLQILGIALLGTLPYTGEGILDRQYGYQVIAGFGCGPMLIVLHLLVPFIVESRDKGVGSSALTQARYMGAVLGLSIVTTIMNNHLEDKLTPILPSDVVENILESPSAISRLQPGEQEVVRSIFAEGFNLQMKVLAGLIGGEILGCLLMWRKVQIKGDGSQQTEH